MFISFFMCIYLGDAYMESMFWRLAATVRRLTAAG